MRTACRQDAQRPSLPTESVKPFRLHDLQWPMSPPTKVAYRRPSNPLSHLLTNIRSAAQLGKRAPLASGLSVVGAGRIPAHGSQAAISTLVDPNKQPPPE
jgi:hypothetical protein